MSDSANPGSDRQISHGRRGLVARLLAAGIGVFLALFFAEFSVRRFGGSTELERDVIRRFLRRDPRVGIVHPPDVALEVPFAEHPRGTLLFRTNNLGLRRDGVTSVRKQGGQFRVLILGDSQTDGAVWNRESFPSMLEFSVGAPRAIEVLNAGIGMSNPLYELLWFREFGERLEPDVVIMAVYVGNDLGDLAGVFSRVACDPGTDGCAIWLLPASALERAKATLLERSAVLRLLSRARAEGILVAAADAVGLADPHRAALARAARICRACLYQDLLQAYRAWLQPEAYEAAFALAKQVLGEFAARAASVRARPALVLIPTPREVEPEEEADLVRDVLSVLPMDSGAVDFTARVRAELTEASRRFGIPSFDLLPALRTEYVRERRPLYWRGDWHLSVEGNRVVAEALLGFLRAERLLPRSLAGVVFAKDTAS